MAWRNGGSLSRTFISAVRTPSLISSQPPPRIRPPPAASPRFHPSRFSSGPSRSLGELGCLLSFLPLHGTVGTSHLTSRINANLRAFRELCNGT